MGFSLSSGSSSLTYLWPPAPFSPIVGTLGIGLVAGVPGDPNPTLAVFGDFTPDQIGEDFSTLFPDANESALISGLMGLNSSSNPDGSGGFASPIFTDAQDLGILIPPGGNFDVVAFSDGKLIGTGTVEVTTAVPEPPSLSLLITGLVMLTGFAGLRLRRTGCRQAVRSHA
jgi:hypothetical protein